MQESTKIALMGLLAVAKDVQARIEEDTKQILAKADIVAIIHHFNDLRLANEEIKIVRNQLEIVENRLSHSEIPDRFKQIGIKNLTIDDVGRVTIGHRWGCSIIDKQVGFNWLREEGHGGIIIETVNASTLAAFAKNMMDTEGKSLPPDKFVTSINPYTSITKV